MIDDVARTRAIARREAEAGGSAVEPRGHRPLRVHARDLRRARPHRAGRGGELQLTDAIGAAARVGAGLRPRLHRGPLRHRQEARDFLQANIELALDRPDLGPELAEYLRRAGARRGGSRDRARRGPSRRSSPRSIASRRSRCRRTKRSGSCSRPTSSSPVPVPPFANTAMDGYAVRAADTAGPRTTRRFASGWSASCRRVTRPTVAVGAGEAIRIMTGAPMPDGADAIVMVELTDARRRRRRARAARGDSRAITCARAGGDLEAGRRRVPRRHRAGPGAPRRARERRRRPRAGVPARPRRRALDRRRAGRVGPARAGQDPRLQPPDAARAARTARASMPSTSGIGARRRSAS